LNKHCFVDLNTELADIKNLADGGRHPLPKVKNCGDVDKSSEQQIAVIAHL
jgi:hypothetical protein